MLKHYRNSFELRMMVIVCHSSIPTSSSSASGMADSDVRFGCMNFSRDVVWRPAPFALHGRGSGEIQMPKLCNDE